MASSWTGYAQAAPSLRSQVEASQASAASKRKPQPRQLLSCTKCRERKVKCDRMKPCSACCSRGQPKDCVFVVGEGNDYSPIQQSYEIRKLRIENQRLRERLQAARLHGSGDETGDDISPDRATSKAAARAAAARQRRFKTSDRSENLYFGTPGLASIIADFANLSIGSHSLTHTMPKAREMYRVETSMYPFPILDFGNDAASLLSALPTVEEIFHCIDMFQRRANATSFPHMPAQDVSNKEIERFLADSENNAMLHPDMLALLFAILATGTQVGVWDQSGGQWGEGEVSKAVVKGDIYIAASMQALRLASFMNQPTLLCIETLLLIGPYLTNSGRFLDAWSLFGLTIRTAHSIGLHRDPKLLDPAPPLREYTTRQTLWWWMLHMDQHYSVTLGRPLGISGLGDCPLPEPLTTDPTTLRLGEFVNHFTVLARQILVSDGMLSISKIDEFTDKLLGLWDTMPESLQFNESWSRAETTLPEWPLGPMSASLFAKVQSFVILLNRQRQERTMHTSSPSSAPAISRTSSMPGATTYYSTETQLLHPAPIRGRALVINSSVHLLQTFLFFYHREAAVLICWTLGQQAFNACMILILDAWEEHNYENEWLVNQAYGVFTQLDRSGVHSLATMAAHRIHDGLSQLAVRKQEMENMSILSRRSSMQASMSMSMSFPPSHSMDTSAMADLAGEQVMGQTGMYLLEDSGLQGHQQSMFQPLGWSIGGGDASAGALKSSQHSRVPSPTNLPPAIPVSNVPIAPFPVMAPTTYLPTPTSMPIATSPFAIGLQPRMPSYHHPTAPRRLLHNSHVRSNRPVARMSSHLDAAAFTPVNDQINHIHMDNSCFNGQHSSGGIGQHSMYNSTQHRIERTPRSQQRRSAHRH